MLWGCAKPVGSRRGRPNDLIVVRDRGPRQLFAELAEEVAEVDVAGRRAWLLAADLKEPFEEVRDVVRLLSYYDCFVVGSRPRDQEERCCTGTS